MHMAEARTQYDEKLALILRKAAAVFAEKGYHRASIRDISRATGVSLSGLYYYFKSKEDLLFQIQAHCFGTVLERSRENLGGVDDPRRRLRLFVETHLRFFVDNMDEMKVLSHEADSLTGEYRRKVNAQKRRYTDICGGIIEALEPGDDRIDPRVATFALFGMMNWIYNWYRPGRDVPVEELAEDMSRLFLGGFTTDDEVAPPTGLKGDATSARQSIWRH